MYQTINEADAALTQWVKNIIDAESVSFSAPKAVDSGSAVNLYLLNFTSSVSHGMQPETPMQLMLRYLVTVWAGTPEREHELLTRLAFGALQQPEFQVGCETLSDLQWTAFGIVPRPCFFITIPITQFREAGPVRIVQKPLIIHPAFRGKIVCRVVDSTGEPVRDAHIALPPLFDSAVSESGGNFIFQNIPAEMTAEQIGSALMVTVNGKKREVRVVYDSKRDGTISFTITLAEA